MEIRVKIDVFYKRVYVCIKPFLLITSKCDYLKYLHGT